MSATVQVCKQRMGEKMISPKEVRQEGTVSTGFMLCVDLLNTTTGEVSSWELDPDDGEPIEGFNGEGQSLDREPTPEERAALLNGFRYFVNVGPTREPLC